MSGENCGTDYGLAKQRWKLLARMLVKKTHQVTENSVSGRRFTSFGLLSTKFLNHDVYGCEKSIPEKEDTRCQKNVKNGHVWYTYKCNYGQFCSANIRHLDTSINIEDLLGFNNTGNVCVWPAEEILTYYCIKNSKLFEGKKVCELGGGMTCLAGVFLALHCNTEEVLLTDGNQQSVDNVQAILNEPNNDFGDRVVNARVLLWNEEKTFIDLKSHFDTVICADCLFFDDYRQDLVNLLDYILCDEGEVIIFAPRRGHTFSDFQQKAEQVFTVTYTENYDQHVSQLNTQIKSSSEDSVYKEDMHYPLMLHLKKKSPKV